MNIIKPGSVGRLFYFPDKNYWNAGLDFVLLLNFVQGLIVVYYEPVLPVAAKQ